MPHRKNPCFNKIDAPIFIVLFNEVTLRKESDNLGCDFMLHCSQPHPNATLHSISMERKLH